jgi:Cu(I)/Ag(I) efflux system membrane protein CusA/SilA
MPIKTRVDMLTTGIRTPIGVKVFGTDLEQIERTGMELERVLSAIPGTRSVYSDRTTGGLYIDIVPDREAIARYGLNVQDVHDVVEAAIGGMAVGVTVEGRNRFSINVRYPRDLRDSLDRLRRVLVPARGGGGGSSAMPAGMRGDAAPVERVNDRNGRDARAGGGPWGPRLAQAGMSDVLMPGTMQSAAPPASEASGATADLAQIPLGQLADIRVVPGPPMIRDEAGLLVGYVYVDIDTGRRDIGGYVAEAKEKVAREMKLPPGSYLKWTGQYELLEQMWSRMKVVVPLTLLIIVLLLWLQFQSFTEVAIVLLSIPFALVGSVWLLWLLDYRMSTAVWVGIIALTGLAAQTGIVMIVYIDNAYLRRKAAGKIRDLNDIIWAHMEGTVMRVRPKLMTVATMMIGLVPLLWATGSGADVMKRIAAPMVGGLVTSAMLTLEIIPVIYTYWRYAQLKREQRLAGGNA